MDFVITNECYNEYFVKFNFFNGACFTATLSKLLGFIIIIACSMLKVPQIMKIYQNESGEGISIVSITLELIANTIYMSYSYLKNFPFSQWGEILFLVTQTLIIGSLVLYYEDEREKAIAFAVAIIAFALTFMSGVVPLELLWSIQGVNILVLLLSRLVQIYTNYNNGHTGQLSAITINLLFLGAIARIFTSIQETGDFITILGNSVAAISNGILAAQVWYYWDVTKSKYD